MAEQNTLIESMQGKGSQLSVEGKTLPSLYEKLRTWLSKKPDGKTEVLLKPNLSESDLEFVEDDDHNINVSFNLFEAKTMQPFTDQSMYVSVRVRVPGTNIILDQKTESTMKLGYVSFSFDPHEWILSEANDQYKKVDLEYSLTYLDWSVFQKLPATARYSNPRIFFASKQEVSGPVMFEQSKSQRFILLQRDGSPFKTVDYKQMSVSDNSNPNIKVNLSYSVLGFNLSLESTDQTTPEQTTQFLIKHKNTPVTILTAKLGLTIPFKVTMVDGDKQRAGASSKLSKPLKVKVVDGIGKGVSNVGVTWSIKSGNGSLTKQTEVSDDQGFSQTEWTLGPNGVQEVEVVVKTNEGRNLVDSPLKFSATIDDLQDYQLEITNYRPDYSQLKTVKVLHPGDKLTVPNKLSEYYRLKYKGSYVKVGQYSLDAASHYFNLSAYPVGESDHEVGEYFITISDQTNNRTIKFPVNLTLNNQIYRTLIGRTINADIEHYGYKGAKLSFYADGTCRLVLSPEFTQVGTFSLNHGHSSAPQYVDCREYGGIEIDKRIIGYAYFGRGIGNIITFQYILVYEDGTITKNSTYACPAYDSMGKFWF